MDLKIIELIAAAYIPSLAYVIINKGSSDYFTLISQSILNTALVVGVSLFVYKITHDFLDSIVAALIGGALGPKYLEKITKKYIDSKIDTLK